jgi:uncharacterized NAD(P)/FAD-binding protein YdhS
MSGVSGDPDHFVRWLRARGHDAGGDDYVPRRWYGDYLTDLLAAAHVPDGSGLEVVHGEAIDLVEDAAGVTLALGDGRTLRADRAVLAVGNRRRTAVRRTWPTSWSTTRGHRTPSTGSGPRAGCCWSAPASPWSTWPSPWPVASPPR